MRQVESEAIREIDYDAPRRRLTVRFTSDALYAYEGVSAATSRAFLAADSKGRFFAEEIRGRYPYRRMA